MTKKLYRSKEHKLVAGVLGGLAEYFGHDATVWRIGFIVFLILTGLMPGVLLYAAFWVVVPETPAIAAADQSDYQVVE